MKAALHNLGCKVNAYETEAMQQILEEAGYEIVPFSEYADVYVINTCSVTNMADRKSRQMLHRAKKQNPDAIVVGAGCYVQTKEAQALVDESIDIVIGNNKSMSWFRCFGNTKRPTARRRAWRTSTTRSRHMRNYRFRARQSIRGRLSRCRMAATSSAHTVLFRLREGASEAGNFRTSYRRYGRWQKAATVRWCLPESI